MASLTNFTVVIASVAMSSFSCRFFPVLSRIRRLITSGCVCYFQLVLQQIHNQKADSSRYNPNHSTLLSHSQPLWVVVRLLAPKQRRLKRNLDREKVFKKLSGLKIRRMTQWDSTRLQSLETVQLHDLTETVQWWEENLGIVTTSLLTYGLHLVAQKTMTFCNSMKISKLWAQMIQAGKTLIQQHDSMLKNCYKLVAPNFTATYVPYFSFRLFCNSRWTPASEHKISAPIFEGWQTQDGRPYTGRYSI